ncbi:MAG: enoyl-CoA hydratase-related protein [Pseudomonadota bacterium]
MASQPANQEATLYEVKTGAAWITLNRPEARNALSSVLVMELYDHINAANADASVRCIVITGAEPAFCSGADLKSPPGAIVDGRSVTYPDVLNAILDSPKPVIAAVNGAAFAGGLGLIGAADIVITAAEAQFSFSEVRIGVIPAVISVVCLPKLGRHHGMRLFLTGARFSGNEAVSMGLAHSAVPKEELAAAVFAEIDMLNLGGPNALAESKKLVRRVPEMSVADAFAATGPWSAELFASAEGAEGMAAFREKRKPNWVPD